MAWEGPLPIAFLGVRLSLHCPKNSTGTQGVLPLADMELAGG